MAKKKKTSQSPENKKIADAKLAFMKGAAEQSGGIVSLDSAGFKEYINNGPRPYHLLVSLTAIGPRTNCQVCHHVHAEMSALATAYEKQRQSREARIASGEEDEDPDYKPTFFVSIDVTHNREIFDALGLNTAPTVTVVPPKLTAGTPEVGKFLNKLPSKYRFTSISFTTDANEIMAFVDKFTGDSVQVVKEAGYTDLIKVVIVLGGGGFVLFRYFDKLATLRKNQVLFVVAAWLFYGYCMSGGMFNNIRGTEFTGRDQQGNTRYVHGGARDQYAAEGYMMGFCYLGAGYLLVVLNSTAFAPASKDKDKKNKTKKTTTVWEDLVQAVTDLAEKAPALLVMCVFLCWFQILSVYTLKNGSYRFGFVR